MSLLALECLIQSWGPGTGLLLWRVDFIPSSSPMCYMFQRTIQVLEPRSFNLQAVVSLCRLSCEVCSCRVWWSLVSGPPAQCCVTVLVTELGLRDLITKWQCGQKNVWQESLKVDPELVSQQTKAESVLWNPRKPQGGGLRELLSGALKGTFFPTPVCCPCP